VGTHELELGGDIFKCLLTDWCSFGWIKLVSDARTRVPSTFVYTQSPLANEVLWQQSTNAIESPLHKTPLRTPSPPPPPHPKAKGKGKLKRKTNRKEWDTPRKEINDRRYIKPCQKPQEIKWASLKL